MADLKLTDLDVSQAVQAAILASLNNESRERIIAEGIRHLTTRDANYAGRQSPLERIFAQAIEDAARDLVRDSLQNDPAFQAQIKSLVVKAWEALLDEECQEKLVDKMATAIGKALIGDRY